MSSSWWSDFVNPFSQTGLNTDLSVLAGAAGLPASDYGSAQKFSSPAAAASSSDVGTWWNGTSGNAGSTLGAKTYVEAAGSAVAAPFVDAYGAGRTVATDATAAISSIGSILSNPIVLIALVVVIVAVVRR